MQPTVVHGYLVLPATGSMTGRFRTYKEHFKQMRRM